MPTNDVDAIHFSAMTVGDIQASDDFRHSVRQVRGRSVLRLGAFSRPALTFEAPKQLSENSVERGELGGGERREQSGDVGCVRCHRSVDAMEPCLRELHAEASTSSESSVHVTSPAASNRSMRLVIPARESMRESAS